MSSSEFLDVLVAMGDRFRSVMRRAKHCAARLAKSISQPFKTPSSKLKVCNTTNFLYRVSGKISKHLSGFQLLLHMPW